MKKKKISVQQYVARHQEISARINEIADLCESENRERTEAEDCEYAALCRESNLIRARLQALPVGAKDVEIGTREAEFDSFLREAIADGRLQKRESVITREAMTTTNAGEAAPMTVGNIVQPLSAALVYDKVGLPILSGLSGDYCWPVVGNVEATIEGEGVALADTKIDIAALKPNPARLGISIKITNQTINKTDGVAYQVVQQQLPLAVARLINKCLCVTSTDAAGYSAKFHGPFVECEKISFAGSEPTYKELLQMKGKVYGKGCENDGTGAYIMNPETYAILEATPKDAGSGFMIIEDGKIAGVPVFQTSAIGAGVGFGLFGMQPLGQFGDMRFIIDPYTEAKSDMTVLTLNADWSMTTLRKEAFVYGAPKA